MVVLVGTGPNWFSIGLVLSHPALYRGFDTRHSAHSLLPLRYSQGSSTTTKTEEIRVKLFAFEGFSVCVSATIQLTLWPGSCLWLRRGFAHTNARTLLSTLFFLFSFLPASMKRLFRPAVPLQAQLWSLTLFGENISFTLWCLLFYKKANPNLKIAWLV